MGAAPFPVFDHRESLRGALTASIIFHVALTLSAVVYTLWGARLGKGWGVSVNAGNTVRVKTVASLPGVPLPMPKITTPNTVAVENPGLYKPEHVPKPPSELLTGQQIPKFKEAIKPPTPKVTANKRIQKEEKISANKRIQKEQVEPPPNAVPYGQGGAPTMSYSPATTPSGEMALGIGQQDFGERYGWYVQAVKNRVSSNWLLSTISPSLLSAPRVYVDFDINRDGSISNAQVKQSSGIPEVDRSALRAVLASSPLAPLPADYSGNKVSVEVYFDLKR
ncbi:MAG: energy transducer TonB [Acidobacteria bacterium]|nr:MAG: energy transducer TonB [Acidobacteriota bacterium]